MRLVCTEEEIDLQLTENLINVLVIENPKMLVNVITSLYQQCRGEEGGFVLFQKDKLLKFEKEVLLILEPFTIDIGDRRIITKLYRELDSQVKINLIEETANINAAIVNYLEKVVMQLSYPIDFQYQLEETGLFKLFGLGLDKSSSSLLEKIVEYLKAMSQLCGYSIAVFLNLKSFLSQNDLQELYQSAFYNKIHLILIEQRQYAREKSEKTCIVDMDRCKIDL